MPNKDKTIAAAQNRKSQAAWRDRLKTYQEWKKLTLAEWAEHNVFHCTKQEDGGLLISLEHSAEGDKITAMLAKLSGLDPDTVIQQMVGEVLAEEGRVWIPAKREEK